MALSVVGVGAANVDLHGRSKNPMVLHDSNPGFLHTSCGGVTRNLCENLARLGADVRLMTGLGGDCFARMLRENCASCGIDLSLAFCREELPTSCYVSLLDAQGDMLAAMSDLTVLQAMPPEHLRQNAQALREADVVVCDSGMAPETLLTLLELCRGCTPVCLDPVSTAYARAALPFIGGFDTVKPNRMELEVLAGKPVTDEKSLLDAGEAVLKKGVQCLLVSLGADGCLYMDAQGRVLRRTLRPVKQMVNATGAGDAFLAAAVFARFSGMSPEETTDLAMAAGIAALQSDLTVNPRLSLSMLNTILKEYAV